MVRNKLIGWSAIALIAVFVFVMVQIAMLPLSTGDTYPPYSSLRADPKGTMALYESLGGLKELRVSRNIQSVSKLKGTDAVVLMLGAAAWTPLSWPEEQLKFFEAIVDKGGRLVIAFLPEPPEKSSHKRIPRSDQVPPIVKRWHVSVATYTASAEKVEQAGSMPRETSAYFKMDEKSGWSVLDTNDDDDATLIARQFGKGDILLLTESYPLSNEGLRAMRDIKLIQELTGSHRHIIFDETHLGVEFTGSVGTLIRRYRLTAAFATALLLGLLFLWKNSSSLLPQMAEPETNVAAGADSQSGLVNLLKRSVPVKDLARACWTRWKETRTLGKPVSDLRIQRVEQELASASASPAVLYRRIQTILTEKT